MALLGFRTSDRRRTVVGLAHEREQYIFSRNTQNMCIVAVRIRKNNVGGSFRLVINRNVLYRKLSAFIWPVGSLRSPILRYTVVFGQETAWERGCMRLE